MATTIAGASGSRGTHCSVIVAIWFVAVNNDCSDNPDTFTVARYLPQSHNPTHEHVATCTVPRQDHAPAHKCCSRYSVCHVLDRRHEQLNKPVGGNGVGQCGVVLHLACDRVRVSRGIGTLTRSVHTFMYDASVSGSCGRNTTTKLVTGEPPVSWADSSCSVNMPPVARSNVGDGDRAGSPARKVVTDTVSLMCPHLHATTDATGALSNGARNGRVPDSTSANVTAPSFTIWAYGPVPRRNDAVSGDAVRSACTAVASYGPEIASHSSPGLTEALTSGRHSSPAALVAWTTTQVERHGVGVSN